MTGIAYHTHNNTNIMKKIITGKEVSGVGIDVAKAMLSVCVRYQEGVEQALVLDNIDADIRKKLLPVISGFKGRIVMESTGHYHWVAALLLTQQGYDVRVVNPILAKQYTSANIRKVKTDPADASGLARMADVADNLPPSFQASPQKLHIRKKLGVMRSFSHHLRGMEASLASFKEASEITGTSLSPLEQGLADSIAALKRSLARLEHELVQETGKDEVVAQQVALLSSIPGVSPFCATIALHWFEMAPGRNPKSWVAFSGIDISSRESGSWKGRCHLTKRGNNYLRARLYNAAWGAVMHDEKAKQYYDALRAQGRTYVEALVIIARKIVRTMFMILQDQEPFDPSKFSFAQACHA